MFGSKEFRVRQKVFRLILAAGVISGACAAAVPEKGRAADAPKTPIDSGAFVGSQACAECHKAETSDWRSSHHALAMQLANQASVLGNFDGTTFEQGGAKSVFFKKDQEYFVRADGPDGKPAEFAVKYAFGVFPLQQYLLELPGGRLQAFGVAWDARLAGQGGQRWFDLYKDQKPVAGDPLHWTGVDQNWNYQCAWCHATNLKKNYDAASNSFHTRWTEIGVGCEACHGPGSNHVVWARQGATRAAAPVGLGFGVTLDERRGVSWPMKEGGQSFRSAPRATAKEILVCAGCHARRAQFSDDPADVAHFHDAFRPALLETPLYYADGQQREEVFEYASFLQSKMYAAGVTCSDCHNPHSGKLRASANEVCAQCHATKVFDQPSHHHHAQGSEGAECANCHMPTTTYMGVHERRDHSLRIPRPDRTATLRVPNACDKCHADKPAAWAGEVIKSWGVVAPRGFQSFAEDFALADRDDAGARAALARVAEDRGQSPLARASAIARLTKFPSRESLELATRTLSADDPLIRLSSVAVIARGDADARRKTLVPLLSDASRLIRMEAARALAGDAETSLTADERQRFDKALKEYVDAQLFNAERAEAQTNLGGLYAVRGQSAAARAAYEKAIGLDRGFFPAVIALAELTRAKGDEGGAETILRKALVANMTQGALHHALGLSLIRQRRPNDALSELAEAVQQMPENPRFAYVYAVALHDLGKPEQGVSVLRAALTKSPNDADLLSALTSYELEKGDFSSALSHAEMLVRLDPENDEAQQLLRALKGRAE
ncbi:MAG: tetratricopeptide repeat protein [Methylocystis sp.]